jgi:hypothetical protein
MATHAELLPRYKQLRQSGVKLNTKLGKTVSRSEMNEGGKRLGILDGDVLLLDSEDEIAVLMDYCLHDVRRYGVTPIQRYLQSNPPPEGSDEWVLLQALTRSWFSVFAVKSTEPGVGVQLEDLLRGGECFIVDVSFGQTASAGMVMAMRVMEADGITMTTGAALPMGRMTAAMRRRLAEGLRDEFEGVDFTNMAPEEASDLAATVLSHCLEHGAAAAIGYAAPGELKAPAPRAKRPRKPRRPRANAKCPCGSGKTYAQCCGAPEGQQDA